MYSDVVDYSWRGNDPNAIGRIENNNSQGVYCNIDALKMQLKRIFKKKPIPGQPTQKNGKPYKAQYIYAVCTKKDSRKKGYMEKLIKSALKDCDLVFEETEFSLPEEYESVRVGDVVKKKIDEVLEEGLTPTKLLIYFLCGAIGLSIGFLIVYFMGK